ncbi:hypothetical protein P7B02_07805 [Caulobacter segnis]|uniref:hypothetical protein n=1 Tax=Caulobacter segnis TaxID=88688 RepID=UPI00240F37FC|nr:hypothetical protein [Caulobacter segnis]MDG2521443.1 hypothetical protein [Caulobacter segnis]
MWSPPQNKLPLVLAALGVCAVCGFAVGVQGAFQRQGPPTVAAAAPDSRIAAPAKDAVPLGAPLIETKKVAETPKEEPKEEEVVETAETAPAPVPIPSAPAPTTPAPAEAPATDPAKAPPPVIPY